MEKEGQHQKGGQMNRVAHISFYRGKKEVLLFQSKKKLTYSEYFNYFSDTLNMEKGRLCSINPKMKHVNDSFLLQERDDSC